MNRPIPRAYYSSGRFYHGPSHILKLRETFSKKFSGVFSEEEEKLIYAAIDYHDIVYVTGALDNEELSCLEFELYCQKNPGNFNDDEISIVLSLIMVTKTLDPKTDLEKVFLYLDWSIMDISITDIEELSKYNRSIFKEFQRFNYSEFLDKRLAFLNSAFDKISKALSDCVYLSQDVESNLHHGITTAYILAASFRPSIGVYVGSFNPFHIGHYNVLRKAEKIFDKVIVIQAKNADKIDSVYELPKDISNRECVICEGFIGDCLDSLKSGAESHFSIVRGMRTGQDLVAEQAYQETLNDLECNYSFCHILCDAAFQHVSSSMIRSVEKINMSTRKWIV
jgi:cytidyltransferase-like protein